MGLTFDILFFSDFDLYHVTEAGKVENHRFLENATYDFGKNLDVGAILVFLPDSIRKLPVMSGNSKISAFPI